MGDDTATTEDDVTGSIEVRNFSALAIDQLYSCMGDGACALQGAFSPDGLVPPGESEVFEFAVGTWNLCAVSDAETCVWSEEIFVVEEETAIWQVETFGGNWDETTYACE